MAVHLAVLLREHAQVEQRVEVLLQVGTDLGFRPRVVVPLSVLQACQHAIEARTELVAHELVKLTQGPDNYEFSDFISF